MRIELFLQAIKQYLNIFPAEIYYCFLKNIFTKRGAPYRNASMIKMEIILFKTSGDTDGSYFSGNRGLSVYKFR